MKHWLFKTEPSEFSIDDLERRPDRRSHWDGIRNYQARNLIRDEMGVGDPVLIYHSSSDPTGVAGSARIVRAPYPDHTAWDPKSDYYDPKSKPEAPTWFMVDVQFEERFPGLLTLAAMREIAALREMMVLRKGMRLSVQPVTAGEFKAVVQHARALGKGAKR